MEVQMNNPESDKKEIRWLPLRVRQAKRTTHSTTTTPPDGLVLSCFYFLLLALLPSPFLLLSRTLDAVIFHLHRRRPFRFPSILIHHRFTLSAGTRYSLSKRDNKLKQTSSSPWIRFVFLTFKRLSIAIRTYGTLSP